MFQTHLQLTWLTTITKNLSMLVPHVFEYALMKASVSPHSKGHTVVLYSTSEIHTSKQNKHKWAKATDKLSGGTDGPWAPALSQKLYRTSWIAFSVSDWFLSTMFIYTNPHSSSKQAPFISAHTLNTLYIRVALPCPTWNTFEGQHYHLLTRAARRWARGWEFT